MTNPVHIGLTLYTSQGRKSYYIGDISVSNAKTFQEIKYNNIYDGIDLSFFNSDHIRYNVDETGDYRLIEMYYQGIDSLFVSSSDDSLFVYTPFATKVYTLNSFELIDNEWIPIDITFVKMIL